MAKMKGTTYRELMENVFKTFDHENEVRFTIGNNTTAEFVPHDGSLFRRDILIRLHGHPIVRLENDGDAFPDRSGPTSFTLAGYPTVTTRDRVNQFIKNEFVGRRNFVFQKNGTQYLGRKTSDDNIEVTEIDSYEWIRLL